MAEWLAMVARRAHNPKVEGSSPSSATKLKYFNNLLYKAKFISLKV